MAQLVKNLPAVQETGVLSLGLEDPPEKEMTAYSRILAWEIPRTEEPGGLQCMGSQKLKNNKAGGIPEGGKRIQTFPSAPCFLLLLRFIYLSMVVHGSPPIVASGGYSSCGVQVSHWGGAGSQREESHP